MQLNASILPVPIVLCGMLKMGKKVFIKLVENAYFEKLYMDFKIFAPS